MLVKPDIFGRLALGEKQQIGFDAGVGREHAAGQTHDGVQITFGQQFLLMRVLMPSPKSVPSGKTSAPRPPLLSR